MALLWMPKYGNMPLERNEAANHIQIIFPYDAPQ